MVLTLSVITDIDDITLIIFMFTNKRILLSIHNIPGKDPTRLHIDIDMRITNQLGLIATTEDVIDTCRRDNIDTWILLRNEV